MADYIRRRRRPNYVMGIYLNLLFLLLHLTLSKSKILFEQEFGRTLSSMQKNSSTSQLCCNDDSCNAHGPSNTTHKPVNASEDMDKNRTGVSDVKGGERVPLRSQPEKLPTNSIFLEPFFQLLAIQAAFLTLINVHRFLADALG